MTLVMFEDLHCDIAPVSPCEYLVVDQDDWFEPALDAASSEGVLGWRISDYAIPNSKYLVDSLEVAFRLTKVYTTALHQFGVGSSIPINFKDLLVLCRLEFSKHEQEKAAKIGSANFILSPTVLAKDLPDLLEAGSLENLIRKRHESAFLNRLNLDRVNHSFGHLPGDDLERARNIALHGSRLVLPEGFIRQDFPSPMRPMAARLGKTYLKHGFKLWEKGQALLFGVNELPNDTYNALNFVTMRIGRLNLIALRAGFYLIQTTRR